MARAPKKPRKTNDPAVILDLEWRDEMFLFHLINRGPQPARDVDVGFRRKITGFGGTVEISALPIWSKLSYLAPGRDIEIPMDRAPDFLARDRGTPLTVVVAYTDADGTRWISSIRHDFTAYAGFPHILRRPGDAG